MSDSDQRLVDLAGKVSDGQAVDWDDEEASQVTGLDGLRTLSKVAETFGAFHQKAAEAQHEVLFRWGQLEVLEKLGEGQFGEVFRAHDPQVDREVALKLDRGDGSLVRTWLAEAQRLARVRHPNVVTVFGAAVHDERAGIWTDLLRGPTLDERLERDGPLGAGELIVVGQELCRALAAVHAAGLVHGDVKTSNVVRDEQGNLVLVDFGAARASSGRRAIVPRGTPSFLAPEVMAGESPSASSDLYALGALLFRLATGQHHKESAELRALRPDLPSPLVAAVNKLLAVQSTDRPASAGEAERLLTRAVPGEPKPTSKKFWAAVVAIVLLAALVVWWSQISPPETPTLQATRERHGSEISLGDGSSVRPGDRLALRVEVDAPTHVYVFNEDDMGNLFVLFPLPEVLPTNPLPAGEHRLPGSLAGEPQSWEVTSAGGRERFLIVGSEEALPRLETLSEEHDRARRGRSIDDSSLRPGETLRGVGGLQTTSTQPGESFLAQVQADLQGVDAIWTRLLELDNPS